MSGVDFRLESFCFVKSLCYFVGRLYQQLERVQFTILRYAREQSAHQRSAVPLASKPGADKQAVDGTCAVHFAPAKSDYADESAVFERTQYFASPGICQHFSQ